MEENKNGLEGKSDPAKTALWTQIVITVGGIAVAAIAAYQAIQITQLQAEAEVLSSTPQVSIPLTGDQTVTPSPPATNSPVPVHTDTPEVIAPLERIDFAYEDSPLQHGWEMLQSEAAEDEIIIEHIVDEFVGKALSIASEVRYGMEYKLGLPAFERGKVIEMVGNLAEDAYVFAYIGLVKDDGTAMNGWLKLTNRAEATKVVDEDEWQFSMEQVSSKGGDWSLYRIDLQDAVSKTFGSDGWKFQNLVKFRIRGNLALNYIDIYETFP